MYTVCFGMTQNTFFVVGGHISKEEALTVLINQGFVSEEEVKGVKHCHQIDVVDSEVVRIPTTMVELA
jgi:cytochrome oxidase assembly protein ShyY1